MCVIIPASLQSDTSLFSHQQFQPQAIGNMGVKDKVRNIKANTVIKNQLLGVYLWYLKAIRSICLLLQ